MTDEGIKKRTDLLQEMSLQCSGIFWILPRDEWFNLADELVQGYEAQQESSDHPNETLVEYAVGCAQYRFEKLTA